MNLALNMVVDETMKEKLITANSTSTKTRTKFCTATFGGCTCQNLCHCVAFQETSCIPLEEETTEDQIKEFFDNAESEENIQRFLKLEQYANEVRDDNDKYNKIMDYLDLSYKNQFDDLKQRNMESELQIQALSKQLKAAQSSSEFEALKASEYQKDLTRLRKELLEMREEMAEGKIKATQLVNEVKIAKDARARLEKALEDKDKRIARLLTDISEGDKHHKNILDEYGVFIDDLKNQNASNLKVNTILQNELDGLKKEVQRLQDEQSPLRMKGIAPEENVEFEQVKKHLITKEEDLSKLAADKANEEAEKLNLRLKNEELADKNLLLTHELADLNRKLEEALQKAKVHADNEKEVADSHRKHKEKRQRTEHMLELLKQDLEAAKFAADLNAQDMQYWKNMAGANDSERRKFKDMVNELDPKLTQAQNNEKKYIEKYAHAQAELEAMKKQLDDLENLNEKLLEEKSESVEKNEVIKFENNELLAKIKELEEAFGALKRQMDNRSGRSNADVENMERELLQKNRMIKDLTEQIAKLSDDLAKRNDELSKLKPLLAEAQKDADDFKDRLRTLQEELDKAEKSISHLNTNKKQNLATIENLRKENDDLKKRLLAKENEFTVLKKELEATKVKMNKQSDEMNFLKSQNSDLEKELENLRRQMRNLESQINTKTKEYDEMRDKYNQLINSHEELQKNSAAKDEMAKLRSRMGQIQGDYDSKTAELERVKVQLSQLRAEFEAKENESGSKGDNIKSLSDEIAKLKAYISKMKLKSEDNCKLASELKTIIKRFPGEFGDADYDEAVDQKRISEATDEGLYALTAEFMNDVKIGDDYIEKKISRLLEIHKRVILENYELTENKNKLNEQITDLSKRHEYKTDLVSKLTVKNFILMSEVTRLDKKISAK